MGCCERVRLGLRRQLCQRDIDGQPRGDVGHLVTDALQSRPMLPAPRYGCAHSSPSSRSRGWDASAHDVMGPAALLGAGRRRGRRRSRNSTKLIERTRPPRARHERAVGCQRLTPPPLLSTRQRGHCGAALGLECRVGCTRNGGGQSGPAGPGPRRCGQRADASRRTRGRSSSGTPNRSGCTCGRSGAQRRSPLRGDEEPVTNPLIGLVYREQDFAPGQQQEREPLRPEVVHRSLANGMACGERLFVEVDGLNRSVCVSFVLHEAVISPGAGPWHGTP